MGMPPNFPKETRTPLRNQSGQRHVRLRSEAVFTSRTAACQEKPQKAAKVSHMSRDETDQLRATTSAAARMPDWRAPSM